MLRLVAALFAAVLLTAQAQNPTPTPRPSQQQPQNNPSNSDASRYERGSEAVPVFTKVIPTAKTEAEARQETKRQDDQQRNDWWVMVFVAVTAVATAVAAIISGIQAAFFWTQLRLMKDGIRDATTAANAAAAEAELARKQYVASNRPKLRVRKVSVTEPTVGEPFVVRYEVVNLGGTKATILTNIVTLTIKPVSVYEEEAGAKGISFSKFEMFANEIQQGESVLAQIEIANFDASLYWADCVPGWWADHLFVIGVIKYADENGVARRTAFYRVATENLNRFEVAKLSDGALADHEYED